MKSNNRLIFRADAVQRYLESQHKTVLPRLICPRTFLYLCILLGLLLLAGSFVTSLVHAQLLTGQTTLHAKGSPDPQVLV